MASDIPNPSWGDDWTVGVRVWVERSGHAILGKGRLELLEGIERWRSISAAAREMGMSYRHAWLLVQRINKAAGKPLVEAAVGGTRGGGARLTPRGRSAIAIFRGFQQQMHQTAASSLVRLVQDPATTSIHVAAAVSLEEVLGQLLADYALQQPTARVRTVFGASDELADHLLAGAPVDLFLTADAHQLNRLMSAGILEADTSAVLAENTLAAIAPTDLDLPVRKPKDLLHSSVTRLAIAEPTSPLGGYTHTYLAHLGLHDDLRPRIILVDNSRAVLAALHAKQAQVGLVYGSDAATATDCRILFRAQRTVPPIRYLAGLGRQSQQTDQARALLRFLTSQAASRRFRQCGFIPVLP